MYLIVHVSQTHIDLAKSDRFGGCPITRAVQDLLKNQYKAHVSEISVKIYSGDKVVCLADFINSECIDFVKNFDDGNPVSPFWFEILINKRYLGHSKLLNHQAI